MVRRICLLESPTLGIPTTEENKKSLKEHLEGKKRNNEKVFKLYE